MKYENNHYYLSEDYRKPSKDHLAEYRNSVFFTLLSRGSEARGLAYEDIVSYILENEGYDVKPRINTQHDRIINNRKAEIKGSRKPSPFAKNKTRTAAFRRIVKGDDYEDIFLAFFNPDDTVEIWKTTFDRIEKDLYQDKGIVYNLEKHPSQVDADLVLKVEVK